ncbi:hypothetical protein MKJ04_22655 [Pontibacter sp. E15-1]|uniref:hypothetical protein n=1 Tax=Pontibacter sp. E15-1 TaxID=2919918 RepID=UPI001F4FE21A|nr:hypothetical protein [Pontibacter sp. E15-1]MCJ8167656.1 hypothetical protein [Pontibacter sp. E15-1]
MGKAQERILVLLKGSEIKYQKLRDGDGSMSLAYFENNFDLLAATELPNIGHYSYYYQNKENPDLVMYFNICSTGLTATLMLYKDAQQRIEDSKAT